MKKSYSHLEGKWIVHITCGKALPWSPSQEQAMNPSLSTLKKISAQEMSNTLNTLSIGLRDSSNTQTKLAKLLSSLKESVELESLFGQRP